MSDIFPKPLYDKITGGINMKKSVIIAAVAALGIAAPAVTTTNEAEAAGNVAYKSCKELNAVHKYGVRSAADKKNAVKSQKDGKITYKSSNATVNANLYKLNSKLDSDKDGIACEK